jgi:hypothetical protein
VVAAETAYARQIGIKQKQPPADDAAAIAVLRGAILDALRNGESNGKWPACYAARRIAWHVLDHAWEIEDRGGIEPERAW